MLDEDRAAAAQPDRRRARTGPQARARRRRPPLHLPLLRDRAPRATGCRSTCPASSRTPPTRSRSRTSRPGAELREAPESVLELLEWAGEPLATREVAVVCDIEHDEARQQLGRVATRAPPRLRRALVARLGLSGPDDELADLHARALELDLVDAVGVGLEREAHAPPAFRSRLRS